MINVNKEVQIPRDQLVFKFSRSSGPGGQNVNKLNTRVTVLLDITHCPCLTESQKSRIMSRLRSRISSEGVLSVVSQEHRSQAANRKCAEDTLVELLREALKTRRARKRTKVPHSAIERRLAQKKRRGELKKRRSARPGLED